MGEKSTHFTFMGSAWSRLVSENILESPWSEKNILSSMRNIHSHVQKVYQFTHAFLSMLGHLFANLAASLFPRKTKRFEIEIEGRFPSLQNMPMIGELIQNVSQSTCFLPGSRKYRAALKAKLSRAGSEMSHEYSTNICGVLRSLLGSSSYPWKKIHAGDIPAKQRIKKRK